MAKGLSQSENCWTNFFEGWKYLSRSYYLLLSGILGFIVMAKTMVPINLLFKVLLGFRRPFAIPWPITNIINIGSIPPQHEPESMELDTGLVRRGTFRL